MTFALDTDWRDHVVRTPPLDGVLMCPPEHFDVVDEKNVFMAGQQGRVDRSLALSQWKALVETYERLGVDVERLQPTAGCEDMVFCANGACLLPDVFGGGEAFLSRMNHPSRRAEVPAVRHALEDLGIPCHELPESAGLIEGHGDVLVVPGRRLALGGHGGRSERTALTALEAASGWPVVPLPLVGSPFYHLDTALALLDDETALVHRPAFLPAALTTLETLFPRLIDADPIEAAEQMACNAHGLADGHVLIAVQAPRTAERLAANGFTPVPVDVSEFHRSGGSVFCMRMDLPSRVGSTADPDR